MALRLVIIIALIIAAMALGFVAYRAISPPPAPAHAQSAAQMKREVAVVVQPEMPGNILSEASVRMEMVDIDKIPHDALPPASVRNGGVIGAMVRTRLSAGRVLRTSDILPTGKRGFLSSALSPGTRAVSIAVDAVTGVAGLVAPDDRVDLVLTQGSANEEPGKSVVIAETILANVRVIAVDQRFVSATDLKEGAGLARTVTLEVMPEQAQRVAVAQQLGRISIAVRPIEPPAPAYPGDGAPTYQHDVSHIRSAAVRSQRRPRQPQQPRDLQVTVVQGNDVQKVSVP